jgi:uncharacterized protein YfkK (UPF0435 family)
MLDLFDIIEEKRKQKALNQLELLQVINARYLDKQDYERYVRDLMRTAGIKEEEKFSREKMDALHAFTAQLRMMGG